MMVPIDDLLPDVLNKVPNCSDPVAFSHLRDAARSLCERGHLWRVSDSFQLVAPDSEAVVTDADASLVKIAYATLDGNELTPVAVSFLDEHLPGWQTGAVNESAARYITQLTPDTVAVAPKATGTLALRLVLKPSRRAQNIPGWMVEQYGSQLGKGAAGHIKLLSDAAVADPVNGPPLVAEFNAFLDRLALAAARGQQGVPLRTRARFF